VHRHSTLPTEQTGPSRRALYRIAYPLNERPTLVVGRFVYDVVDCSERGLCYSVKDRRLPALGTPLGGTVNFHGGLDVEVEGEVLRIRAGLVVLALEAPGIPFAAIMSEQRYLRGKGFSLREE